MANAQCALSGTATAGTNANNNSVGTVAWSGTNNTATLDGAYASAGPVIALVGTTVTNYLTLDNFGFNVPAGYTICGVGLSISKASTNVVSLVGNVTDNVVQLAMINSPTTVTLLGTNQATGSAWPYGTIGTTTYGGIGNNMGASLSPAVVNDPTFGVAISANILSLVSVVIDANVDKVSMSLYAGPIVLPIAVDNFTVTTGARGNELRWTATATNDYVVQRSADGIGWQDLTTLVASSNSQSYSYTDETPLSGPDYYRLKIVHSDGTTDYSKIGIIATRSMPTIRFYPNPFHDIINIVASAPLHQIALTDPAGRVLWIKKYSGPSGAPNVSIPAANLPPGMYFLTVDGISHRIIKN